MKQKLLTLMKICWIALCVYMVCHNGFNASGLIWVFLLGPAFFKFNEKVSEATEKHVTVSFRRRVALVGVIIFIIAVAILAVVFRAK